MNGYKDLIIIVINWTQPMCHYMWVNKQIEVLLYNGILLINLSLNKKELTCKNEDKS